MSRWRLFTAVLVVLYTGLAVSFAQPRGERGGDGGFKSGGSGVTKQDFWSYRGQRKPVESDDLYMEAFSSLYDGDILTIDISFNQGIDPRSVKGENIVINGKTVEGPIKLTFNKEATVVRMVIGGAVSIPYSFSISGIKSYNGKEMDRDGLEGVGRKDFFSYQEGDGWMRK